MTKICNVVCTLIVVIGIASMEKIFEALDGKIILFLQFNELI